MKTIPIDEQMGEIIERANKKEYEKFVQAGIDQWRKENSDAVPTVDTSAPFWQSRNIESSAEMPRRAEPAPADH
jgi:hypothetical protein